MTQTTTAGPPEKLDRRVFVVAGVVVLGSIMSILDVTVVSVAQQTFMAEWHANTAEVAWSMTGYTLALAAVIPTASWAAGRFGTKNVYLVSLVLFLLGSILCATAWSIETLVAFRIVQGLGGGLLMPVGMMIITRAAGPERVGSVMAILGIPMLLGPITGPILGGWLIEAFTWHWVFLINVPLGIIALIYAWFALDNDAEKRPASIDFVGLLLLSPGLALFLFGVSSSAEHRSFAKTGVYVPMIIGAILIALFIWHAMRAKNPLLDLRLFRNRTLAIAVITAVFFMVAFFGASLLYPQYFIVVREASTLKAGLLLAPQGLGAMLTMPIAGRMTDRIGPGKFVLTGLGLILIGLIVFTQIGVDTSLWLLCGALFVQGLGLGMSMMPIMSTALASLRRSEVPDGSTLVNVIQQSASSVGTAVMTVIFTTMISAQTLSIMQGNVPAPEVDPATLSPEQQAEMLKQAEAVHTAFISDAASAYGNTFIVAACLVGLTFIPAFFMPRKRIASADAADETQVILH